MPLPLIERISDSELKLVYKWLMQNGSAQCQLCLSREDLTFDHIIPKIRSGSNDLSNLCILCSTCNVAKGSKMMNLVPLTAEAPHFDLIQIYDLEPGVFTIYGKVEAVGFVGKFNDKDMYVIEFSGEDLLCSVLTGQRLYRRLAKKPIQSRPGDQWIPLDPRFCLV